MRNGGWPVVVFAGGPTWLTAGSPTRFLAQQRVLLEHPELSCSGSLLAFDAITSWLELKSGSQACQVLSSSPRLPIPLPLNARFHRLRCHLPDQDTPLPIDNLSIEQLELLAGIYPSESSE